jgi:hypothetical protein
MKALLASVALLVLLTPAVARSLSDDQARKAIIQESLAAYPGPCPCPYNVARNGSSCGRRSAYSRPGGYSPICYDADVTDAMIRQYQATR